MDVGLRSRRAVELITGILVYSHTDAGQLVSVDPYFDEETSVGHHAF